MLTMAVATATGAGVMTAMNMRQKVVWAGKREKSLVESWRWSATTKRKEEKKKVEEKKRNREEKKKTNA
jgi:hypothetical protein